MAMGQVCYWVIMTTIIIHSSNIMEYTKQVFQSVSPSVRRSVKNAEQKTTGNDKGKIPELLHDDDFFIIIYNSI